MVLRFKERLLDHAGPRSYRRFLVHCADYINAVAREAELREHGEVLDLAAYMPLRRENSAIRLCFGLFESALGIDLPDEVFQDEQFMMLYWSAADMVCWSNVSAFGLSLPTLPPPPHRVPCSRRGFGAGSSPGGRASARRGSRSQLYVD